MLKKSIPFIGIACIILLIAAFIVASSASPQATSPSGNTFTGSSLSNHDEIISAVRYGLRNHSKRITVTFAYEQDVLLELPPLVDSWIEESLQETSAPTEGDYIRYQYGGYESTSSSAVFNGLCYYTIEIIPQYYTYLAQEEEVSKKAEEIINAFEFDESTSDYLKIATIYAYLCEHVSYDLVHEKNPHYFLRSTAYAALIQETATCQGYCVALYRLLRQVGINTRIVTGPAYGVNDERLHAWNIVALDGKYYCLDATWDAGKESYRYFLKGTDFFLDHTMGEAFSTSAFAEQYPIAEKDYVIP